MSVVRSHAWPKTRRGRADPGAERGRGRFGKNSLDDVVQVQQQAAGMGWRWFQGRGVHGVVVPVHRVEVGVRADRLSHGRAGAHAAAPGLGCRASMLARMMAPARGAATRWCPLAAGHRAPAEQASLRVIARPAREPCPIVTRARSRAVQKVDSIGLIVFAVATTGRYGTRLRAGKRQVSFAGDLDGDGWLLQGAFSSRPSSGAGMA
jgi:hypothetical protein